MARARAARRGDALARARARAAAARLPGVRRRSRPLARSGGRCRHVRRAADAERARARRRLGAGRAGRRPVRRAPRRAAARARRAPSSARTRSRGSSKRAAGEAAARLRRRRPPAARGLRRRGQLRRHPEHPVHERLLLPLRVLRVLEGQARREPARRAVSRPARRDRPARARRRGSAARPRCACRAGSTRRSRATTTRTSSGRSGTPCPASTCTRSRRSRSGRARRRSTSRSSEYLGTAARPRARLAAGNGCRGARRRGAPGDLPRQGDDGAVARRCTTRRIGSACARTSRSCSGTSRRRVRGRATCCARASSSSARAGSPSSCRCPFVPMEAPIYLQGRARRGPTFRETLLVHAVARLALHPEITNIQASWVKLGPDGHAAGARGRRERPRRHAHERVDLALGRRGLRAGDAAGANGGADPLGRPRTAPAHDALRGRARRAASARRSERRRSPNRSIRPCRTPGSSLLRASSGPVCSRAREPASGSARGDVIEFVS